MTFNSFSNSESKIICDVVVLTWNKIEVTKNFVKSFLANTSLPARIIFVDNFSEDGTREFLLSLKNTATCTFKLLFNECNEGFIKGCNQGLSISQAPFICLANNDLDFTPGWLEEMLNVMEKRPEIGLLNPNSNNLGMSPAKGVSLEEYARQVHQDYQGRFVEMPFCVGFCMLLRRSVYERVGGLSQDFLPMFFEDSDYSLHIQKAGYRLGMAKGAYVWHQEHASMGQLGEEKEKIFQKSKSTFNKKWGKILRIGWIVKDMNELREYLYKAIEVARQGNYIWFYVKGLNKDREVIFKEANCDEFTDVKFISYSTIFDLIWKVIIKKKKYDLILVQSNLLQFFLRLFRQNSTPFLEKKEIHQYKF